MTKRPFIIPAFIPHAGCPHRCVFCNQKAITGLKETRIYEDRLRRRIETYLNFKGNRSPSQIAFFGGNFLGLPSEKIKRLLDITSEYVRSRKIDSIRFSTRPDTIEPRSLDNLAGHPVSDIELGAQSMEDHVLKQSDRGHTAKATQNAVGLLKERNYRVGIQMMIGLPGETENSPLITADHISNLMPDYVRIYPTVVLKGSPLALLLKKGLYSPLGLDRAVTLAKRAWLLFDTRGIPVIRMGLQASKDLDSGDSILAGPYHPAFGHMVYSEIFLDSASAALSSMSNLQGRSVQIAVHPKNTSKMRGIRNKNIHFLTQKFKLEKVRVTQDPTLSPKSMMLNETLYFASFLH